MNAPASNRLIGALILALFCYLGLFTWNSRTGYLDTLATRSGLEIVAYILSPITWVRDQCADYWSRYIALVRVADENTRLRAELRRLEAAVRVSAEDKAELARLRELLSIKALEEAPGFGARVIAMRFGPQSVLRTVTVDKGFVDGALAGTPVIAPSGVVGRVLRSAPHAATVLLLTDPGFRVAVVSQESRTPGILTGSSDGTRRLDVAYVAQNARIAEGELLVTAGTDGDFPKGVPVGVVTGVQPGHTTLFLQVHAQPLVPLERLEEVVLLLPPGSGAPLRPKASVQLEEAAASEQGKSSAEPASAAPKQKNATQPTPRPDAAIQGRQDSGAPILETRRRRRDRSAETRSAEGAAERAPRALSPATPPPVTQ